MKLKYIILAAGTATLLSACGGGGSDGSNNNTTAPPAQPETRIVNIDLLGGRVAIPVQFIDAKSGQPIIRAVTLNAADNMTGSNIFENSTLGLANASSTGSGIVFLKAGLAASKENPVKLRLMASAEGYFSSSIDVYYNGSSISTQRITLVNKLAPPDGVAIKTQTGVNSSVLGTLESSINLTAKTSDIASRGASATFSLPSGTVVKDSAGNPLTGPLKVSIAYFSPNADNIGSVFPGGLSPDTVRVGAESRPGYFISAGLLAVDIEDSAGRKAHLLENARGSMTIQTPAGTLNPETGQPIKDGDQIPVWSHNERTGLWSRELTGTFRQNAEGNFEVSYAVNHLSYWNLDWHYSEVCQPVLPVSFSKQFSSNPYVLLNVNISGFGSYGNYAVYNSNDISGFYNVPKEREVTFTLSLDGTVIGQGVKPANSCQGLNINVSGNLPVPHKVDTQVLLVPPQGFSKAQIESLLNSIKSLTGTQRLAVLKYTHPTDPNALFKLDQAAYQKLMDIALSKGQVASLQALMSLNVQLSGYFSAYDSNWNWYGGSLSNTGSIALTLPSGSDTTFQGEQSYSYTDWWTGQTFNVNYYNTWIYGYIQSGSGGWKYFQFPLKKPHTIRKEDNKTTIIFEDMDAIQRVLSYLNAQRNTQ